MLNNLKVLHLKNAMRKLSWVYPSVRRLLKDEFPLYMRFIHVINVVEVDSIHSCRKPLTE